MWRLSLPGVTSSPLPDRPPLKALMCSPQRVYLPPGSLGDQLCYPRLFEGTRCGDGPLKVTVHGAWNLRAPGTGWSHPYCVCRLQDRTGDMKIGFETCVVPETSCPVWDETFEFTDFMPGDPIAFTICDKAAELERDDSKKVVLGKATLRSMEFYPGPTCSKELPLNDVASGLDAFIRVSVEVPVAQDESASNPEQRPRGQIESRLEWAVQNAGLKGMLQRFPRSWYAERIWEDVLSGGEQQRLAIARILYWAPRFVLLDDCSSMVAAGAEEMIYRGIRREGITPLTCTQRMFMPELYPQELALGNSERGWHLGDTSEDLVDPCPSGCGFARTWHPTHCCGACQARRGTHGPSCERRPRRPPPGFEPEVKPCPGNCGFAITWHSTHCCAACAAGKNMHGGRCDRKLVPITT